MGRETMSAVSTSFATLRSLACVAVLLGVSILAACSDDEKCDNSKCAKGNTCLPLNGETKCRKTCESNSDPATSCPFGYICTAQEGGIPSFCVQGTARRDDGKPLEARPSGQWGARCQANLKMANPGCDGEQGFLCYGDSPTDGDAYCTRYDCTQDSDCGAGFWCGKINTTPNVETSKRKKVGEVQNVCLRRNYCAPCKTDLDCPSIGGTVQHCVADDSGATTCAPECTSSKNCNVEAKCTNFGQGWKACAPRAGVCVGDGKLCSPCRVDTDCGDGACIKGQYTTERFCAAKSESSCGTSDAPSQGSCPTDLSKPEVKVYCVGKIGQEGDAEYCAGVYGIGTVDAADLGCWTPDR